MTKDMTNGSPMKLILGFSIPLFRADRYVRNSSAYGFSTSQGVIMGLAGIRYFPSVTSTTAMIMTPSANHSTDDSVSPANVVPNSTATTGFTYA